MRFSSSVIILSAGLASLTNAYLNHITVWSEPDCKGKSYRLSGSETYCFEGLSIRSISDFTSSCGPNKGYVTVYEGGNCPSGGVKGEIEYPIGCHDVTINGLSIEAHSIRLSCDSNTKMKLSPNGLAGKRSKKWKA